MEIHLNTNLEFETFYSQNLFILLLVGSSCLPGQIRCYLSPRCTPPSVFMYAHIFVVVVGTFCP